MLLPFFRNIDSLCTGLLTSLFADVFCHAIRYELVYDNFLFYCCRVLILVFSGFENEWARVYIIFYGTMFHTFDHIILKVCPSYDVK